MEKHHLEPPVLEKNWMISPPGSPTEGWEQVVEDPPNSDTLHHDIQDALARLAAQLGQLESPASVSGDADEVQVEEKSSEGQVIIDTTPLGGVQVVVTDYDAGKNSGCDDGQEDGGVAVMGRTPRPPVQEDPGTVEISGT